ncbi:MAG: methyltransferase domain-containing protein [Chitinophagaceae bacterium]|nr:methyltransferase domain-containing protein [Chitinophagaceae bacterium]
MSRYHSHINTALGLLKLYKGEMPFSIFIKQFFSKEKKYGSKDRKQIAALCYSYFRVGLAFKKQLTEDNLLKAFFLTNTDPSLLIEQLKPAWSQAMNAPVEEKLALLNGVILPADIFPFAAALNDNIDVDLLSRSFFIQPGLFVRIRPRCKAEVIEKIKNAGIEHRFFKDHNCVQFPSGTRIENFLETDKEVVIQDLNSQLVLNYISSHKEEIDHLSTTPLQVWDCCAASGGKSILINDLLQQPIKLTVSDIRQSIVANLRERFKKASIDHYDHFIADICDAQKKLPAQQYNIIICDAPCTGSGTWSRTPEQLYFFDPASIDYYATQQKKIVQNIHQRLDDNGLLFYITCSVFKKENEAVAAFISQQPGMHLIEMKNLYGYEMKADSMFVAVFKKQAPAC